MEQSCPQLAICKLQHQKQQDFRMCRFKDRNPTILMADCRGFPKPLHAIVKQVTQAKVIQLPDKSFRTLYSLILLQFHSM
jgi:hypothetical protein